MKKDEDKIDPRLVAAVRSALDRIDEIEDIKDRVAVIRAGIEMEKLRLKLRDDEEGKYLHLLDGEDDDGT
ncbi:MAG: hypothetical protein IRY96_02520 [Burkholderiales bacterium]|nr:hypothetical protein [Burkholderiales bacterium]